MIIQNGTIEFKTKTAGGIDPETGIPSNRLPWPGANLFHDQFKAKKFNQLGIIKGEHFTVASYEILIEEQPVSSEQLRLKDLSGKEIGTFSIIQAEPLEAVCEVRILV